jgi:hypothetical protein
VEKDKVPETDIDAETPAEIEPKDIFEDFDTELFKKPVEATKNWKEPDTYPVEYPGDGSALCPYYPKTCHKSRTSQCTKKCEHNPDNFMVDPKIKDVFEKEPWSNYCFTCGEFIPSRNHENALDPPEVVYSHIVATGFAEYKTKLKEWVVKRITGE